MEEKKNLKLNVNKQTEKDNKLTYEQLNNACNQLFQQNQYLSKQLKELNTYNMFKRLDYLFDVIKNADTFINFGNEDFVNSCVQEIKEALTINEDNVKDSNEEQHGDKKGNAQA